jgi:selenocysteine lyase/cysteine desulfurase
MTGDEFSTADSALSCQKDRFSLPEGCRYLNCAYMSPLSKRVEEAGVAGVRRKAVPARIRPADFFTGCDEAKRLFAELVNATAPARVALIPAVSYGLSTVARNTPVAGGQNIVTVREQFPSNVHPWRRLSAETGAEFRSVASPSDGPRPGADWNEAILEAIDADTALVALGPIHWTDGTRFDLSEIGERAREVGAAFIVDGTQAVGVLPFDVQKLRPDALICAAYKWLTGPYSIGAAYFGPRYDEGVPLEETWQSREGSEDFAGLVDQSDEYRSGAARYDGGEPANFVLVPMLIAALEQLLGWGVPRIQSYIADLTRGLFSDGRLQESGLCEGPPETDHLFGMHVPPGVDVAELQARLRERDVFVSVRGSVIRVSPHVYNDASDIDALKSVLLEAAAPSH